MRSLCFLCLSSEQRCLFEIWYREVCFRIRFVKFWLFSIGHGFLVKLELVFFLTLRAFLRLLLPRLLYIFFFNLMQSTIISHKSLLCLNTLSSQRRVFNRINLTRKRHSFQGKTACTFLFISRITKLSHFLALVLIVSHYRILLLFLLLPWKVLLHLVHHETI